MAQKDTGQPLYDEFHDDANIRVPQVEKDEVNYDSNFEYYSVYYECYPSFTNKLPQDSVEAPQSVRLPEGR